MLTLGFESDILTAAGLIYFKEGGFPVCHVPPGNPSAARTIYVGYGGLSAHTINHGDKSGSCEDSDSQNNLIEISFVDLLNRIVANGNYDSSLEEVNIVDSGRWVNSDSLEGLTTVVTFEWESSLTSTAYNNYDASL